MLIRIKNADEIQSYEEQVRSNADRAVQALLSRQERGLELLRQMKFAKVGSHPLLGRELNLIEQVNQTFTYLVSLRATRWLYERYPGIDGFLLNLGTRAGSDIESIDRQLVAAEVFAAVTPNNNRKLVKDLVKVSRSPARDKFVFFFSPGYSAGRWTDLERLPGVQVWAVDL